VLFHSGMLVVLLAAFSAMGNGLVTGVVSCIEIGGLCNVVRWVHLRAATGSGLKA
jgi:hypothetical protein